MEDILCKGCKQKTEHYAKGLCQKCYTKQYMRDFFKKTKKKMVLVDNDLWIFLNKNKIKKD